MDGFRQAIGRTRRRLRLQRALEVLTTGGLLWAIAAAVLVFLLKARMLELHRFWELQAGAAGVLLAVVAGCSLLRIPPRRIAKQIDDSHGLHDRVNTALEFMASPRQTDFMRAQVEDAKRRLVGVEPRRAAPLRAPRDLRAFGLLLLCLGLLAVLRFPSHYRPVPAPPRAAKLAIDPDELEGYRAMLKELEQQAAEQDQPEISKLAEELNKLFDEIQRQELTRKELFAKIAELEKKLLDGMEGNFDELMKKLKKMSDELQKEKLTKDLAKDLKDADLQQAKKDMEKLAKDIDKMKENEKKALARSLEKSARQKLDDRDLQKKKRELEDQIRRLQKQQQKQAKNDENRRRLEKKKRELERLNREQQQTAKQQRQLERLNKEMQQAAEALRQSLSPEAMKALQQAAQQMGRFAQERSKMSMSSKAQSQLQDLKEFLRRLGQGKGQKGKLADFIMRAGGKKPGGKDGKDGQGGQGKDGKDGPKAIALDPNGQGGGIPLPIPGQGTQQQGQGQDSPMGQPGNGIGTSTDPNISGKASSLESRRRAVMAAGKEGKGPTRSEVILGAADKGFAASSYKRVYKDYTQVIEDVLKQEDVPLGYQYFVKRYFQLIKPR